MKDKISLIISIIVLIAVILLLGIVGYGIYWRLTDTTIHPEATFEIENYGTVKIELYPEYAPNTVANFIKLIENGYYNGKVIYGKDDMCMYLGRNSSGEIDAPKTSLIFDDIEEGAENDFEYTISGEFVANKFKQNTLSHEKGVVTLIRNDYTQYISSLYQESYDSGNSQFSIIMSDSGTNLNGAYAAFGKITEGLDMVEKIYNEASIKPEEVDETTGEVIETDGIKQFETYPVITSATVDTHGENFGLPEVLEAFDYNAYMSELLSSYYSTGE